MWRGASLRLGYTQKNEHVDATWHIHVTPMQRSPDPFYMKHVEIKGKRVLEKICSCWIYMKIIIIFFHWIFSCNFYLISNLKLRDLYVWKFSFSIPFGATSTWLVWNLKANGEDRLRNFCWKNSFKSLTMGKFNFVSNCFPFISWFFFAEVEFRNQLVVAGKKQLSAAGLLSEFAASSR